MQVVDKASGQPVPGAKVLYARKQIDWTDDLDTELKKQLKRLHVDPEASLRLYGQSVFADDEGNVELGFVGRWHQVVARKGDRYGQLHINLNDRPPKEAPHSAVESSTFVGFL